MDVSQVGLRFRCIEVLVLVVVKVIFQPRLAVAFSKILALSFFFEILFRHTGTSITFENRGTPVPFASTNDRRRRRVKVDRAVADTKTEDEEGVPRDDDRSKKYDARRRFKIRDVDRDVNSCFFPFFTNDSSRDESNAPRTGWFAAPSARRKFHSVNVACFLRQHARGAVRGAVFALVAVYESFNGATAWQNKYAYRGVGHNSDGPPEDWCLNDGSRCAFPRNGNILKVAVANCLNANQDGNYDCSWVDCK